MEISMRNNGREAVLHTPQGEYIAYAPLEPKNSKFPVKTPQGNITYMNKEEFLKTIIYNAPNDLERTPQKDCFQKS